EGQVADLAPGADGAALRLQQDLQDVCRLVSLAPRPVAARPRPRIPRKIRVRTSRAVRERADVRRQRAPQLVNPRRDQLEVRSVFQARILADLLVVFLPR